MVTAGRLAYPYSLREQINIVRHLSAYPGDAVGRALRNVCDFDVYEQPVLRELHGVFRGHELETASVKLGELRLLQTEGTVHLGGVETTLVEPRDRFLVPPGPPGLHSDAPELLEQLRWMMQKDALGQDMYLLGPPGPRRRWLALQFCHAMLREAEYLPLSRDTTEADIKQRREMRGGTLVFADQPAVRAAIEGRVLIVDGVERAERNVLPVINNLLENREMALEDGRFLTNPARWQELLAEGRSEEDLRAMGLVPVSPRFRVIALGLPVPRYEGTPLDPPLRSRFQCMRVGNPPVGSILASLKGIVPSNTAETMAEAFEELSQLSADRQYRFPDLLAEDLQHWAESVAAFPSDTLSESLRRVYPYHLLSVSPAADETDARLGYVVSLLHRCGIPDTVSQTADAGGAYHVQRVESRADRTVRVTFSSKARWSLSASTADLDCGRGEGECGQADVDSLTEQQRAVLTALVKDHCLGRHSCVVGGAGCGKTRVVREFAQLLGFAPRVETLHCHWDMSARDMLQRRVTLENGDTLWEPTALTAAALSGRLAVLDGVDRLQPGVLASLGRLLTDGDFTLYDGTVLRTAADYERLLQEGWTKEELDKRGVRPVHPAFRVIATARTPLRAGPGGGKESWMHDDVLRLFSFHQLRGPSVPEIEHVLSGVAGASLPKLLVLHKKLEALREEDSTMPVLSLRQLLRIARQSGAEGSLHTAASNTLLTELMPGFAADKVRSAIEAAGIRAANVEQAAAAKPRERSAPPEDAQVAALIPSVVFFENKEQAALLRDLRSDLRGRDHLLLIGKQGVGKNRVVDRLLQDLSLPRQYIQLHRDSTVASLTVRPAVDQGRVVWEDAPLVKAAVEGRVLVIDEVDKAPLEVVGVLRGLIEDRELVLSDGRRLVDASAVGAGGWLPEEGALPIHPDFRVIALANVPGYPFLGNDFFAACGDLFRCHLVDNPAREATLEVLRKYGPGVPRGILHMMVDAFEELSALVSEGLLAYPYSLRELVQVVRHVDAYPRDGLVRALRTVFDFDEFDAPTRKLVAQVFESRGIPLTAKPGSGRSLLAQPEPLQTTADTQLSLRRVDDVDVELSKGRVVKGHPWEWRRSAPREAVVLEGRREGFGERVYTLPVPIEGAVIGVVGTSDGALHALLAVPGSTPALVTWSADGVYTPQQQRPTVKDHGSYSSMDLWFATMGGGDLGDAQVGALVDLNTVTVWSPNSATLVLVDPAQRDARRIDTPLLQQSKDGDGSWGGMWRPPQTGRGDRRRDIKIDSGALSHGAVVLWAPEGAVDVYDAETETCLSLRLAGETGGRLLGVHTQSRRNLILITESRCLSVDLPDRGRYGDVSEVVGGLEDLLITPPSISPEGGERVLAPHLGDKTVVAGVMPELSVTGADVFVMRDPKGEKVHPCAAFSAGGDPGSVARLSADGGGLRVVDTKGRVMRRIDCGDVSVDDTEDGKPPPHSQRRGVIGAMANGCVAVATPSRRQIAVVDVDMPRVKESWKVWRALVGGEGGEEGEAVAVEQKPLQMQYSNSKVQPKDLKHGKEDPDNTPHVGGNQWAGGTGGTDTAGLGGKIGPYRLDKGHPVHQVSDEAKRSVPEHLREQAKAMGKEALAKRLKEIDMSDTENDMYSRAYGVVKTQIALLQTLLRGLRSKEGDRVWLRHQTDGVWDESKLVEGLTGEKNIFRRRGEPAGDSPTLRKKKRLVFCFDCSGSMYRFNGVDGRLDRSVEAAVMVMEALSGFEDRIEYEVLGHSGDSHAIPLIRPGHPPRNKKERLDVALKMVAHAQFCWSGDHTLECMEEAVTHASRGPADQRFVFVISDANLRRYGISTSSLARIVKSDPRVNVYCIFIASGFGDEAEGIRKGLPQGKGHVCLDSSTLPAILKRIFLATDLLK
eukprot:TRINITY_DN1388_c0_g1_i1.p1 TRINITY_DN1388_c0_g1~~TRINITY_DN1388_c0_g1_i1.p1  ORF type:complete len:1934 (+),score=667.32 TRINITY_DN1388_c0_g1_i1:133-5802(+)